jgi:hypothetical protein
MSLLSRERKICPKCGQPYSYIDEEEKGGRVYLYAIHYYKDPDGRKRKKKCYLGPKDGYEYVSKTHEIIFYGLDRQDRYIRYLEEILDLFTSDEPVSTEPDEFKRDFENVMRMRSLAKKIERRSEERLRKILESMTSDLKASADVLRREYRDNPQALELVKEIKALDEEIERTGLVKSFIFLKDETLRSYVERYLQLKNKMKMFNI